MHAWSVSSLAAIGMENAPMALLSISINRPNGTKPQMCPIFRTIFLLGLMTQLLEQ